MPLASPGKKLNIVASDWNDMQAMLREWRHGRLSFGGSGVSNPLGSTVWVKNISANDVTPGDVLGLGNPVITPTDDVTEFRARLAFEGSIPSTSTPHYDQYGIVQEACAKTDGFCRCVVSGITFCKLNITHAADLYCEIANSISTYLTTAPLGSSRILWKDSGTGSSNKWGLIRVGEPSTEILVKNNSGGDFAGGSSCTGLEVHTGTTGGSESDTGQRLTAYNRSSQSFKNGKYGSAAILHKGVAYVSPQQT
jgi:hypothetical protein